MKKEKKCKNCGNKVTAESRRTFCNDYCFVQYQNNKKKPIRMIDKLGREYICCSGCGSRLKKYEHRGITKLLCHECLARNSHKPYYDSQTFVKRLKNEKDEIKEVKLEITQNNNGWHYVDGLPVQGFQKARNYFRAKIFQMNRRFGFVEIDPPQKIQIELRI